MKSLSAHIEPAQRTHWCRYSSLSTYLSKRFHLWYVIRLLYSIPIFSLCSQTNLLKACVGNMTHVVHSFQPLCYSTKQLLCVHAQLDSQNSTLAPPDELACWRGRAYLVKTNTYGLICQLTGRHDLANQSHEKSIWVNLTDLFWGSNRRSSGCQMWFRGWIGLQAVVIQVCLTLSGHDLTQGLRRLNTVQSWYCIGGKKH